MPAGKQIPFQINLYAVDLKDNTSALVASTVGQLELPKTECTQHMVFPVTDLGRYELYGIAFTIPPNLLLTAHRGPTLNVIP
jgi:hypothetical protein